MVDKTVPACSPPITDIRAFGHIYKKRGLKRKQEGHKIGNKFLKILLKTCILIVNSVFMITNNSGNFTGEEKIFFNNQKCCFIFEICTQNCLSNLMLDKMF